MNGTNGNEPGYPENALVPYPVIVAATNGCPAFAQIKPDKINLSLFGRLLGTLEGTDHVNLVEGTVGGEVDDKRKAKGKHHGEHVA